MLFVCSVVFYSQSCKNVERIVDLLNKAGAYKDISDALFIGFLHFGTSVPYRGFSKEIRIYAKGFKGFARTVLEPSSVLTEVELFDLLALQKIVRKKNFVRNAASWNVYRMVFNASANYHSSAYELDIRGFYEHIRFNRRTLQRTLPA